MEAGPHTIHLPAVEDETTFIIKEEDIPTLNTVTIFGKMYPVYKDHIAYYILVEGTRCNNGYKIKRMTDGYHLVLSKSYAQEL